MSNRCSDSRPTASGLCLTKNEQNIYNRIQQNGDKGANKDELRRATHIHGRNITTSLQSLLTKALVKEVQHFRYKGLKYYIAVEFEPSEEITGGPWYLEGKIDTDLINSVKTICLHTIRLRKTATFDFLYMAISAVPRVRLTEKQVKEILDSLVLDKEVMKVKSIEMGQEQDCYKLEKGKHVVQGITSIPCITCPRVSDCTPDGVISPDTCVYYKKWFDF